jgi:hypothetical protein
MCGAKPLELLCLAAALTLFLAGCSFTEDCSDLTEVTEEQLLDCVTVGRVVNHLQALQTIAEENGGNRAADTAGYDASLSYIANTLEEAGYEIELDDFDLSYIPPTVLRQTAPDEQTFNSGVVIGTGSGAVSGSVCPIELNLDAEPRQEDASAACEMSDFACVNISGENDVVLFQEGGCPLAQKALNAQQAGAEAAIFLMREFPYFTPSFPVAEATLLLDGTPANLTIPIVATSDKNASALAREGLTVFVEAHPRRHVTQYNLLAELPGEEPGQVVMAGAHLDSVPGGPGIDDNGSGSAALLETAVQMAGLTPKNTVRFAWWGAEEYYLVGSSAYVDDLTPDELEEIALYMNFDLIASPNPVYFIYDKNDMRLSETGINPDGSEAIEELFETYYAGRNLPFLPLDIKGRGDHAPFEEAGIPSGGIITLTEGKGKKTKEQAEIFGGIAGEPYDPCYRLPCDDIHNINEKFLDVNADAVAYSIYHFAMKDLDSLGG